MRILRFEVMRGAASRGSNPTSQLMPIKVTSVPGKVQCNYHVLICRLRRGWVRGPASKPTPLCFLTAVIRVHLRPFSREGISIVTKQLMLGGKRTMANKTLFKSLIGKLIPATDALNEESGPATALSPTDNVA